LEVLKNSRLCRYLDDFLRFLDNGLVRLKKIYQK